MKTINQILNIYIHIEEKEEIIKKSIDYVEKYNDLSLEFDDAEMTNKIKKKKKEKKIITNMNKKYKN